jgi:hypothetical protein
VSLETVKKALEVTRFIWVDDAFHQPRKKLEELIELHPEVAASIVEFADLIKVRQYKDITADLAQRVKELPEDRETVVRDAFLAADAEADEGRELPHNLLQSICDQLGVQAKDRLTFPQGEELIESLTDEAKEIALVLDLKETGSPDRGLDLLQRLHKRPFGGLAFIVTHEATLPTESQQESELTSKLEAMGVADMPVTVIAKERLDGGDIEHAFTVALKRAGLRKALRSVLYKADEIVRKTIGKVVKELLALQPERLEEYVFRRGRDEGESELEVIERALSASISRELRKFMSTDSAAADATRLLRALQGTELDAKAEDAGDLLEGLRRAEMWDDGEVVNDALRPLANGDVFEFDAAEASLPPSDKLFVLLGQPCDIQLRPTGRRVTEVAMLVPLSPMLGVGPPPDANGNDDDDDDADKDPELPFLFLGKRYRMRLRETAYIRLSVLDLATFRSDGRVAVTEWQAKKTTPLVDLMQGPSKVYAARIAVPSHLLANPAPTGAPQLQADEQLLLTLSAEGPWKHCRAPCHMPRFKSEDLKLPQRVTWRLIRKGRVRAPYSTFMLERVLGLMGRRAFDNDYIKPIPKEPDPLDEN